MWIRFFCCTWLHTKTMSRMMSFRNNRLNADCDVHEIILHRIWRIQIGSVWFPLRVLVFGDFFFLLFILILFKWEHLSWASVVKMQQTLTRFFFICCLLRFCVSAFFFLFFIFRVDWLCWCSRSCFYFPTFFLFILTKQQIIERMI